MKIQVGLAILPLFVRVKSLSSDAYVSVLTRLTGRCAMRVMRRLPQPVGVLGACGLGFAEEVRLVGNFETRRKDEVLGL